MGKNGKIKLLVQIAAFGSDGIERVAKHQHPAVEGVHWLVSLQTDGKPVDIPDSLKRRTDFDIIVSQDRGVARNRNHALDYPSDAPLVLLSDDDIDYTSEGLSAIINAFDEYPDADVLCFRYRCDGRYIKAYGDRVYDLKKPPFGWYPTTFEIAFRRDTCPKTRFNEKVGPGSGILITGEDTVWFRDAMRRGAKGYLLPIDICSHNQPTTGERLAEDPRFIRAHGAIMTHLKPLSWMPRLLLHARRSRVSTLRYLRFAYGGAWFALKSRLFRHSGQ